MHAVVAPPEPVLVVPPVLVHVHPLLARQATSVYAEHVPVCVPEQLADQTHPVVAVHEADELCPAQAVPTWDGVPPHVPRSTHPTALLQSVPVRAEQSSGVPEHVPCELPTVLFPPRGFAFNPGQSLQAPAAIRNAADATRTWMRCLCMPLLNRRRRRRATRITR